MLQNLLLSGTMKTVFFDLDGTLTDPGLGITNSVLYALKAYGIEEKRENLYSFIGPPLVDSFQSRYGFSREQGFEATRRFQEYFSRQGLFENEVYKGIVSLLADLKKAGKQVVLVTSKPEEFSLQILEHFQLISYFDFVCGATMDEKTRSHKDEVMAYAIKKSGALPEETVMVGDRCFDIEAAKKFGIVAVGVLYGYGDREELVQAGADVLCPDVSALRKELLK